MQVLARSSSSVPTRSMSGRGGADPVGGADGTVVVVVVVDGIDAVDIADSSANGFVSSASARGQMTGVASNARPSQDLDQWVEWLRSRSNPFEPRGQVKLGGSSDAHVPRRPP